MFVSTAILFQGGRVKTWSSQWQSWSFLLVPRCAKIDPLLLNLSVLTDQKNAKLSNWNRDLISVFKINAPKEVLPWKLCWTSNQRPRFQFLVWSSLAGWVWEATSRLWASEISSATRGIWTRDIMLRKMIKFYTPHFAPMQILWVILSCPSSLQMLIGPSSSSNLS